MHKHGHTTENFVHQICARTSVPHLFATYSLTTPTAAVGEGWIINIRISQWIDFKGQYAATPTQLGYCVGS